MKIEYEIKGVKLNEFEMYDIKRYYEAACTAEYVVENYEISDEVQALQIGYDVRRLMDKYGFDEDEAIVSVLREIEEELEYEN